MRKKFGWTALGVVGFIFAPMGLLFTVLGVLLGTSPVVSWRGRADGRAVFLAVFCGIGGLFLLLGLVFLGADLLRRRRLRRAWEGGNCVQAEILGLETVRNVSMPQGSPRVVQCAWTGSDGVVHVYRSRYVYADVTKLLQAKTVPVYVDRFDENVGFVDIDAVLPEIRIH